MNSVRKALRTGTLRKDTYERLVCEDCGRPLRTDDRGGVGWRRSCPDCGRTWKQLP
ncbi:HVO_0758 family zinc finger protein [Halobacterium yunchengense]|uniref:HVO_0758 family zinc finger protein n=1 Tax=Halobacterium yunchengense TaxID=3108497 RepID=UPI00300B848C